MGGGGDAQGEQERRGGETGRGSGERGGEEGSERKRKREVAGGEERERGNERGNERERESWERELGESAGRECWEREREREYLLLSATHLATSSLAHTLQLPRGEKEAGEVRGRRREEERKGAKECLGTR